MMPSTAPQSPSAHASLPQLVVSPLPNLYHTHGPPLGAALFDAQAKDVQERKRAHRQPVRSVLSGEPTFSITAP
ncbi:hypothetical protein FRC12_015734 [Ceratobasidium sp. 428]|nr:hypothetical protein FRC12_015734 [Ceratobasidium sp. 428]